MGINQELRTHEKYFAAANGYNGFRSYFNEVFKRTDYTALYILKGGSGTGKSTLMKTISLKASELGMKNEAIYCSSDPESLDGVIIYNGKSRFAIIDGTAPHEEDTRYPGIIDEIINLGEFWNKNQLKKSKKKIIEISKEKQKFYANAYSNLSISSVFDKNITAELIKAYNFTENQKICEGILNELSSKKGNQKIRLVDGFCKFGFYSLPTLGIIAKRVISVIGKFGSEHLMLSTLYEQIKKTGLESTVFPNPLDPNKVNAIYLPAEDVAFVANASAKEFIDTEELIDESKLYSKQSELGELSDMQKHYLNKAEEQFVFAADMHSELEKIYTPAMDFTKFDSLISYLSKEIFKQ